MAGVNDIEEATINMYADQLTDFVNEISKVFYEQDATKKAELTAKLEAEIVPKHMKFLEDKLNQTKTGYFVGNSLTWIDLYLIAVLEWLNEKRQSLYDHFPTIKVRFTIKLKLIKKIIILFFRNMMKQSEVYQMLLNG